VGAELDEIVSAQNTTHGLTTTLRNIKWPERDILLGSTTTYGPIERIMQHLGHMSEQPRPDVYAVVLQFPMSDTEIIDAYRAKIQELKQKYSGKQYNILPDQKENKSRNRFVAAIDNISSMPGVLLPWKELVKLCHEEGTWAIIDAARSIGPEFNINLAEAKTDFWVSNWLYAKRGCAAVYRRDVPRRNQHVIKSSIPAQTPFSPIILNPVPATRAGAQWILECYMHVWLSTPGRHAVTIADPSALAFRNWLGGEEKITSYNRKLAIEGGKRLAELLGTRLLDEIGEQTLSMARFTMFLKIHPACSIYTDDIKKKIGAFFWDQFFNKWDTYIAFHFHNGEWWARISAQVWNEVSAMSHPYQDTSHD
ncbi:pyridoxal phosphate-dependent transferase, partial [Irpex lacteus]